MVTNAYLRVSKHKISTNIKKNSSFYLHICKNLKEKLKNDNSLSKKVKADHRNRMPIYRKKIKEQKQQEQPIISMEGLKKSGISVTKRH